MRLIDVDELKEHKFVSINCYLKSNCDNGFSQYKQGWNDAIDAIIDNAPTVELDESIIQAVLNKRCMTAVTNEYIVALHNKRPTGHWIKETTDDLPVPFEHIVCSNCKKEAIVDDWYCYVKSDYCPNCGADMRKEANNDTP